MALTLTSVCMRVDFSLKKFEPEIAFLIFFFLPNGNCFLCSLSLSTCSTIFPRLFGDSSLLKNFKLFIATVPEIFHLILDCALIIHRQSIEADTRDKSQCTISCLIFQSEPFFNLSPIKFHYASSALDSH